MDSFYEDVVSHPRRDLTLILIDITLADSWYICFNYWRSRWQVFCVNIVDPQLIAVSIFRFSYFTLLAEFLKHKFFRTLVKRFSIETKAIVRVSEQNFNKDSMKVLELLITSKIAQRRYVSKLLQKRPYLLSHFVDHFALDINFYSRTNVMYEKIKRLFALLQRKRGPKPSAKIVSHTLK